MCSGGGVLKRVMAQILDTAVRNVLWRGVLEGARARIFDTFVGNEVWRRKDVGCET